jgi:hypothetical protein
MGQFKIEIVAVGGHGCQREVKDGGQVFGCGYNRCPDCTVRELVAKLLRDGNQVESATITHWPGQESQVVDNLLTKHRKGSF